MERDELHNESLRIVVDHDGAELASLTDTGGVEYLWQGDPSVWSGRSPVLFPVVGRLAGDVYSHAGWMYTLPQHGFARRTRFVPLERLGDGLAYELRADDGTRLAYPFDFVLTVTYRLDGASLGVEYRVRNLGSAPMPFSIGGHPAFSCAWHRGDLLEDYYLEFEQSETADTCGIADGLIDATDRRRILTRERILPLTRTLFDKGALVFEDLISTAVTLRSRRHANRVRIDFPGFPWLGIWSKPAAPFVCIEPWYGHADPAGRRPGSAIDTKPGIIVLEPNRTFECSWRATILPDG